MLTAHHYCNEHKTRNYKNAIALACNGKIEVDQIGQYYKKILGELSGSQI